MSYMFTYSGKYSLGNLVTVNAKQYYWPAVSLKVV